MLDQSGIRADAIFHVNALRERFIAVPGGCLNHFESQGTQVFLRGPQGIFKPKDLDEPLTILSSLASSYRDEPLEGDRIRYSFLPESREFDNDGLKRAAELGLPLIYLMQVCGEPFPEYEVFAPVWVVGWDDETRQFQIDLSGDRPDHVTRGRLPVVEGGSQLPLVDPFNQTLERVREARVAYHTGTSAIRRIHQAHFRRMVLDAWAGRCGVCGLRIRSLLDAAHVRHERRFDEVPPVNEGISLCAIHHRAFDAGILGYDDAWVIGVNLPPRRRRGRGEAAMLNAFDGQKLKLPAHRADWPLPCAPIDFAVEPESAGLAEEPPA